MTDKRLQELLRGSMVLADPEEPQRDLWPRMLARFDERPRWSYVDLGLAAAAAIALAVFPEWLWLLAYHL
jgi:hypothetical protein